MTSGEKEPNGRKTMAIRLEDDVHQQLVMLAQLDGLTITDEIRQAIESHIAQKRDAGDLAQRAEQALASIEEEAAQRRAAIQSLLGSPDTAAPSGRNRAGRKPNGETSA